MRLHDLGRAGEGDLPRVRPHPVQEVGPGFKKPFCINPECPNFLPEDQRGYKKKAASAESPAEGAPPEEEKKPAQKAAAKKTAAKKPAAKTAAAKKTAAPKKTAAKKPAAKKAAAKTKSEA